MEWWFIILLILVGLLFLFFAILVGRFLYVGSNEDSYAFDNPDEEDRENFDRYE